MTCSAFVERVYVWEIWALLVISIKTFDFYFMFEAHYHSQIDFFCLFVTDLERREIRFKACRMRNDNRRNMELLHVARNFSVRLFARTTQKGNKAKMEKKSLNMKDINEVIKVKENPLNVILESQTNKQQKNFSHFFPHNIFAFHMKEK